MFGKVIYIFHSTNCVLNTLLAYIDEQKIILYIAANIREEQIIIQKITANYCSNTCGELSRTPIFFVQKIAHIKTTGITKIQGNFVAKSFQVKFI